MQIRQRQAAELARFKLDTQYYRAHREELLRQYPEQWVAIYHQRVVGAAADPEVLLDRLEADGIPTEHVLFQHLTTEEETWILPA